METNLETAILNALYDYFESHLGSPQMPLFDLCEEIGVSPDNEEIVRKITLQLYCLKSNHWVDYQAVSDGLGGLATITTKGIKVAEDRRKFIAATSVEQSEDDESREPDPGSTEPASLELVPNIPETVLIPAGFFWMGSAHTDPQAYENEKPHRQVRLQEYRIGRYPVTNAQYACFVHCTDHPHPHHWNTAGIPAGQEDHPVVNVSYDDADAYCRWLCQVTEKPYRLPTEEEWEKAARGSSPYTYCYPWGPNWKPDICNTRESGQGETNSIYKFADVNASPSGVVDMAGNVWEWTDSWYERYPDSRHQSLRYGRVYRVVRGGSWQNTRREARIACRGRYKPQEHRLYLGFRIALD